MQRSEVEKFAKLAGAEVLVLAKPEATEWLMNFLSKFGDICINEGIDQCVALCEGNEALADIMKGKKLDV